MKLADELRAKNGKANTAIPAPKEPPPAILDRIRSTKPGINSATFTLEELGPAERLWLHDEGFRVRVAGEQVQVSWK